MEKALAEAFVIRRKIVALNYAKGIGNVKMACRELGVSRASFHRWKKAYEKDGIEGLIRKKPVARSHPRQIPPEYVEKILHLRSKYHLAHSELPGTSSAIMTSKPHARASIVHSSETGSGLFHETSVAEPFTPVAMPRGFLVTISR